MPATSSKVTPVSGSMWTRARVFPNAMTPGGPWPIWPDIRRIIHAQKSSPSPTGAIQIQKRSPIPPPETASYGDPGLLDLLHEVVAAAGDPRRDVGHPCWPAARLLSASPDAASGSPRTQSGPIDDSLERALRRSISFNWE